MGQILEMTWGKIGIKWQELIHTIQIIDQLMIFMRTKDTQYNN